MATKNPIKHLTDLTVDIADRTGMSREKANTFVHATIDSIADYLKDGNDVSIYQFGRFKRIEIDEARRLKPNSDEMITVPKHTVVHFAKSPKFEID